VLVADAERGGPPPEDTLVPTGPPKTPKPSSSIALPVPKPEELDMDAIGRPLEGK
jgi:hypothetical protein